MQTIIGTRYGSHSPFAIDSSKHINVEGMSGMGKSTLHVRLFIEHIRSGLGGAFIDPHGDPADEVMSLIPRSRMWDVVYLDPFADRVPPFNPLHYSDPAELELGKESLFSVVKSLAGAAWGDESARVTMGAIDAVCEWCAARGKPATPIHVFRFLADDAFRDIVLSQTKSPLLIMFREQYDRKLRDSEQMAKFSPAINKFGKFLRPSIMPIVGQPDSLDFLDIMNTGKIVVCRLSKGRLGDETAQILGSFIVSMISIAALRRERQANRPHFMIDVDETANFTHGGRFGSLLAESRKYGVSLVSSFQGGYQTPLMSDFFSNCPTKVAFNVSGTDARAITDDWLYSDLMDHLTPEKITALPRYEMYCRTFVNDSPTVARLKSLPPIRRRGDECDREKLIAQSLIRWGRDRRKAEARITRFLSSPARPA